MTRADVALMLRADALNLGLGVLLLAAGLAASAVYVRSRRGVESVLPWFGLFSFLYGLRLLARTDTFPLFFSQPPLLWRYVASVITYVIPVPVILLLRAAFPAWRRPLGVVAAFVGAFAVSAMSGHGVPAALIASMVKVAIAAQKSRADHPAAVLAGMNDTLVGRLSGQYVTAVYLFRDREAGVMRYSAAGHPPLLRWRRDEEQRTHELEENGLPLGLMDVAQYRQLEQPLHAGDRFLLYTDGLVDATNAAGEFFTVERVKDAVAASAGLTTEGVADLLVEKTRAWADKVAADDLTVVLVDCI